MATAAPIEWIGDATTGALRLLDQTRLPNDVVYLDCRTVETVFEAIRSLRVRGAPAIGVAAAYGVVVSMQGTADRFDTEFITALGAVCDRLASSRPTAVNLFWALDRMKQVGSTIAGLPGAERLVRLHREARTIEVEDQAMCAAMGRVGAAYLTDGMSVLTHCNAGALATAGDGTALSVIYAAREQGLQIEVYANETRPLLQGARLTCWELMQRGVPTTLICDNMAGWVMKSGRVDAVIVGADRIAANGDAANKIGTYSVAQLAKAHGIPFYVAAPSSTFDLSLADGSRIPIEERAASEITHGFGKATAPAGVRVFNPAFDVTPASLIRAIFTEKGAIEPVNTETVRRCLGKPTSPQ
ncbi:MAG: S-methyl-5-thioribose-1-phosphate isomerase [Planctomycetota bacterium]|nr:MAG: S-methyl-5-thioribose-1-phosphate isomerase [Planctomycetota bacterium]